VSDSGYRVDFGPDLAAQIARNDFFLTECIKAADSGVDPDQPDEIRQARIDDGRLVLSLGPESTEDDTYSTLEVSSTRRFDQQLLDQMLVDGDPRVMIPGRQAVFRDVVFSPEFADQRAARETVTTGVIFQSWRGIEEGGVDFANRPEFMVASVSYIGGTGVMPAIASRSLRTRRFFASVVDFKVGLMWFQILDDFDPTASHEIALRWELDRDVSFVVDGKEAAHYRDGKVQVWPLKLMDKRFRKGVDLIGHRHLSVDPCHIDMWLNSSRMGSRPVVPNGRRFSRDLWVGLSGFGVEPL
jgi:hypothetical protein